MNNPFDETRRAVAEAQHILAATDNMARSMAYLLVGRLRHVSNGETLIALKKELRDFDAHRKVWKK